MHTLFCFPDSVVPSRSSLSNDFLLPCFLFLLLIRLLNPESDVGLLLNHSACLCVCLSHRLLPSSCVCEGEKRAYMPRVRVEDLREVYVYAWMCECVILEHIAIHEGKKGGRRRERKTERIPGDES